MKKGIVVAVLGILILIVPFIFTSCISDNETPAKATTTVSSQIADILSWQTNPSSWINQRLNTIQAWQTDPNSWINLRLSQQTGQVTAQQYNEAVARIAALEASKTSMQSTITQLQTDIATLKASGVGTGTGTGTGGYTGGVAGQVSFSLVSAQPYYQLSSGGYPINIKIFNNTGQSRYVRPQITLSTFDNSIVPTIPAPVITVTSISNSSGQLPVTYPSPAVAGNTILLIGTGGGVNGSGEYLVNTGGVIDIFVQMSVVTTPALLWKMNVSGSDRPIN